MSPPSRQHRTISPLRSKAPSLHDSNGINEAKLVQVIQTLDTTWKSIKQQTPWASEGVKLSPLSDSLREAFKRLLEVVACLDKPDLMNKAQVVTVCTARLLGCLKRFVEGNAVMELGGCCERKCEQRLIHLTLLSILFRMCREPGIASNVVKEDLHKFLIKMCVANAMQNSDYKADKNSADVQDKQAFDPYDLMITIDPFDWCYQPLCTRLFKENQHSFFIPLGIRSLICLLRGITVPTDEISEFEQQVQGRGDISEKGPKRRKLPSIFAFQHNDDGSKLTTKQSPLFKLPSLCCESTSSQHENRGLWMLVLNDNSRMHLALRCLIMLAICVPRVSVEYKSLIREGNNIRRVLNAYNTLTSKIHNLENTLPLISSFEGDTSRVDLLPFQAIAIHVRTLKRIACSALPLFAEEKNNTDIPKHICSTNERRVLSPLKKKPNFPRETHNRKNGAPLLIQQRLNAASEAAHSEITRRENKLKLHCHGGELERNSQSLAVRKMCADVENLREHLAGSLQILCSGRQHPDPRQSFSEWIKSLPTLETLERERQYQQELRQHQVLEQQYQREAQRRRERNECVLMHSNDYNIPEENELSIQQQKHEQFLRMQAEMRQFKQHDLGDDYTSINTAVPTKKEKLAIQERQRLLQLESQRREGRELEKMRREDLYYVEHILKTKAKAKEEHGKRVKSGNIKGNAIEEQQKHIARMRLLDEEKRLAERETCGMQLEDLLGRQMRFREVEHAKEQLHNEWRERKSMQAEEHNCRTCWALWERALVQKQQEELKQQRAEERRLKRQQLRQEKEIRAAWVETWDANGNKYFYNSVTGSLVSNF